MGVITATASPVTTIRDWQVMELVSCVIWLQELGAVLVHIILHSRQLGVSLAVVEISKMGHVFPYLI